VCCLRSGHYINARRKSRKNPSTLRISSRTTHHSIRSDGVNRFVPRHRLDDPLRKPIVLTFLSVLPICSTRTLARSTPNRTVITNGLPDRTTIVQVTMKESKSTPGLLRRSGKQCTIAFMHCQPVCSCN